MIRVQVKFLTYPKQSLFAGGVRNPQQCQKVPTLDYPEWGSYVTPCIIDCVNMRIHY